MKHHFSLLCSAFLLSACARSPPDLVFSGPTMGTAYTVKIANAREPVDKQAVQAAIDTILARIDREMSGYRGDSELSRFNAATTTEWFDVSADVVEVVDEALAVAAASEGALDITIAPLVDLWGFGPIGEPVDTPTPVQIETTRAHTGYRKLQTRRQPPALRKASADLTLDLNSVAPGFATDLLFERLHAMGFDNVMVDIGGEVRARGRNPKGEHWRIAVEKPLDTEPEPFAIVQLDGMAVTTSGEYRHYYSRDGKRYSHTIDPRTGRPVQHTLASVVVVGSSALNADAWATALNVLGEEAGYALAIQRNMPAMFIVPVGGRWQARMTPAFEPYLAVPPDEN